jgi:hypothetical protein
VLLKDIVILYVCGYWTIYVAVMLMLSRNTIPVNNIFHIIIINSYSLVDEIDQRSWRNTKIEIPFNQPHM